jgi:hypothetical protein
MDHAYFVTRRNNKDLPRPVKPFLHHSVKNVDISMCYTTFSTRMRRAVYSIGGQKTPSAMPRFIPGTFNFL